MSVRVSIRHPLGTENHSPHPMRVDQVNNNRWFLMGSFIGGMDPALYVGFSDPHGRCILVHLTHEGEGENMVVTGCDDTLIRFSVNEGGTDHLRYIRPLMQDEFVVMSGTGTL